MFERIVVATDGAEGALGALRVAGRIARRDERPVEVVAVLEPAALEEGTLFTMPGGVTGYLDDQRELLERAVRRQIDDSRALSGRKPAMEVGPAAWTIARYADEHHAGLIVIGKGEHGALDRWLGGDTAAGVVRVARVPVLAVAPWAVEIPRSAVVAVDFSEYARDAALSAADLMGDGAEIHLTHVAWEMDENGDEPERDGWRATYRAGVEARLEELAGELRDMRDVRVTHRIAGGKRPVRELLRIAAETDAELIAAGSHGPGFFTRLMGGSVSRGLMRGASCSVLVAPPRAADDDLDRAARLRTEMPFGHAAAAL